MQKRTKLNFVPFRRTDLSVNATECRVLTFKDFCGRSWDETISSFDGIPGAQVYR